jgi:hypothetical protein
MVDAAIPTRARTATLPLIGSRAASRYCRKSCASRLDRSSALAASPCSFVAQVPWGNEAALPQPSAVLLRFGLSALKRCLGSKLRPNPRSRGVGSGSPSPQQPSKCPVACRDATVNMAVHRPIANEPDQRIPFPSRTPIARRSRRATLVELRASMPSSQTRCRRDEGCHPP